MKWIFYGLDLSNAKFHSTHHQMVLSEADFSSSVLTGADFSGAWLSLADLSGADLSGSIFTDATDFNTATWTDAFYYTDNEPTWASGMDAAWQKPAQARASWLLHHLPFPNRPQCS